MKSSRTDYSTPSRKGKHINAIERQQMERWLLQKMSIPQIASLLQRHRSTIYRERKRGLVISKKSDLSEYKVYRAQRAQDDYCKNYSAGGPCLKLSWGGVIAKKLHTLMSANRMSPYAAIQTARRQKLEIPFSDRSLYNYIHQYNYPIRHNQLPMKGRCSKRQHPASRRLAHNNLKGNSIEKRPAQADGRMHIGHWEMDLVVGAKGGRKALLVLTECKTRYEYILLLKDKSQKSVIQALNRLERKYGTARFRQCFQSITCDNGPEFLDFQSLEKSCMNKGRRTKLFYAHPFSSFERGSNENANRLIRRILPKKTIFDKLTQRDVDRLAQWMNYYPRRLFDGLSAHQKARAEKFYCITLSA